MILHTVLMRVPDSQRHAVMAVIGRIGAIQIAGFWGLDGGLNESPEPRDLGFNLGFVARFDDWAALARYQDHPQHQTQGRQLLAALINPDTDLLVFDLDTGDDQAKP
ncbi:Dabb family protein [Litorivicinus lipolyticus]|jgi:hypothetical protein|uniref:Dabb family protein n=1 Tax=Litorivicinus lipolyticus TaxID=418701 RepID=UPI003B5BBDA4